MTASSLTDPEAPRARTPPGPGALGSILLALRLLRDPRVVLTENARKYGPVWQMQAMLDTRGPRPLVMLMGPRGNERVLSPKYKEDFSWYEGYQFTMEPLFGRDILFLLDDTKEAPAHRMRHRTLIPAFHPRLDDQYIQAMRDIALHHFARFEDGAEVDLCWEVKRITFHIVARLLFGAADEDMLMLTQVFEELGLGLFTPIRVRLPGFRFYRGQKAHRRLSAYVRARILAYRQAGAPPANMLGQLMRQRGEAGDAPTDDGLPDEALVGEMLAFLFAGYDTTSSLLISTFTGLAGRPDLYEAVRAEARALTAHGFAAMQEERHLEATLTEAERMYPPLTFALRGVLRDIEFEGFAIPAGSKVAYSAYHTGRMPELFERPDEFLPERFLGGEKTPPYAILGFGGGHRSCIGKRFALLEMRLLINLLLARFDVEFLPRRSDEVFFNPAMQRRHGFPVRLRRLRGVA